MNFNYVIIIIYLKMKLAILGHLDKYPRCLRSVRFMSPPCFW